MSKSGLRIDANFTEDVVGFALESFLTLLTFPRYRFSIEPFSRSKERWLGADARLHGAIRGFRPFYMQFKRPAAYPDFSRSKIILHRQEAGLESSPRTLYFPLRRKQEAHRDFQHNVLLRLRERLRTRGIGDAAYVCPLFLDCSAYRTSLYLSGLSRWGRLWRRHPWELEDILLKDGGTLARFDRLPVLAKHITVPPHKPVTTASHSYSFTESGKELCFHSPQSLPEGSMSLADYLSKLADGFLNGGEKLAPSNSGGALLDVVSAVYDNPETKGVPFDLRDDDPVGNWFNWGDHLQTEWGIEQYAFVRWEDDILDLF